MIGGFFLIPSCNDDELSACDDPNSEFQALIQNLVDNGYDTRTSYDVEVHGYTFTLSERREVCVIGYQSQPDIASIPYTIEILNNVTNTVVYSDEHVFSSTETSYVTPTSVIELQPNISYTILRIQTNYNGNVSNLIGRYLSIDNNEFPYESGIMTITNANTLQSGSSIQFFFIPYIDLVFN